MPPPDRVVLVVGARRVLAVLTCCSLGDRGVPAMLAADPGLAETLEKVKQSRDRAEGMRDRFETLTPEQREQLKAAREKAKDDPAVDAAREKMKSAESPEARRAAGKEMHEAMKAAMLKQNPGLEPLLEKLGPPPHGAGHGPQGPPLGRSEGE